MRNYEFHVPFVKSLLLIAIVTLVSMASAHLFIKNSFSTASNPPEYTSSPSYNSVKAGE